MGAGVTIAPSFVLIANNESYAFIDRKWSFFDVLSPDIES